jgi:hypothetical protein
MTINLGSAGGWATNIYSHSAKIAMLHGGAVVRNGCPADAPLSEGVFFLKASAADKWHYYDQKANSVDQQGSIDFTSDQLFLPVQCVSSLDLFEFRNDLKLQETVVKRARQLFEDQLGISEYILKQDDGAYDVDEDDCPYPLPATFGEINPKTVDAAWLAVVKQILRDGAK